MSKHCLVWSVVAWACLGISTGCSSVTAQTTSAPGGTIPFGANQYVLNNMWNASSDPSGTESVTVISPTSWSTTYNWPRVEPLAVRCYPSCVLGWQFSTARPGTGLPVKLSSHTPVMTTTAFTTSGSACQDIAYDCWYHGNAKPGAATKPTDEMMIWEAAYNGPGPIGTQVATANIDGHVWKLFEGWNGMGWEVHTFVISGGNLAVATLNLTDFNNFLCANKYHSKVPLLGARYLTGVEFGTEVVWGSGTMTLTKYTCVVGRKHV